MDFKELIQDAKECTLSEGNEKLTIYMNNGDKIEITGKQLAIKVYYLINGK